MLARFATTGVIFLTVRADSDNDDKATRILAD